MLSRRDKLLVQPWHERRYKDHRSKVATALPAIDASPPPPRPHVTVKLKLSQREQDRRARLLTDNYSLLQRLSAVMEEKRLDNCWRTPLPNLHQKVGLYTDVSHAASLATRRSSRATLTDTAHEERYRCYACELKRQIFTGCLTAPGKPLPAPGYPAEDNLKSSSLIRRFFEAIPNEWPTLLRTAAQRAEAADPGCSPYARSFTIKV